MIVARVSERSERNPGITSPLEPSAGFSRRKKWLNGFSQVAFARFQHEGREALSSKITAKTPRTQLAWRSRASPANSKPALLLA